MEKWTDEQIRELCDKATEGPWGICLGSGYNLCTAVSSEKGSIIADCLTDYMLESGQAVDDHRPNMEFIAAARELVPILLDRAQRAEARLVEEEVTNEALLADAGIRNGVLEKRIDRLLDVIHDDCECESFEVCSNHVSGADCATGYDCKKCWRAWLEQEVQI